ncbi:hypothetical protein HPP92_000447 [Vanilla planifolia]|uniref:AT1G65230-like protein n=1 Tax=Vanilla planifolia TaxID=51239 RepID=A0A835RP69_VANPL|nr:hypothetical protein HPP92_000447 [Vanilla planifolia]
MSTLSCPSAFCRNVGAGNVSFGRRERRRHLLPLFLTSTHRNPLLLRVVNESQETEAEATVAIERLESDKIVDAVEFGELCNDFECISSPSVEATARQLARDILELRDGSRSLGSYATSVKYKDPVRTFRGRQKYIRPLWATDALENPSVIVQGMQMLSTSELIIKWTLKGRPKNPLFASLGGDLVLQIDSRFIMNQISGQVTEHEELWDLSASSAIAQTYFWISRRLFSAIEAGKDAIDEVKSMATGTSSAKENMEIYPDMSGDPTKFFQGDDDLQRDVYQIGLFLAVIYFVLQFLKTTL